MNPIKYIPLCFLLCFVRYVSSWEFFTSLDDFTLGNDRSDDNRRTVHSEYRFGTCKKHQKLYAHVYLDHLQVLGKLIIRGWLNIFRIPTCIILRATSWEADILKSNAYNFQICVPRITYCHSETRFVYYYYEWYIPTEFEGGMNWDLYFFGSGELGW